MYLPSYAHFQLSTQACINLHAYFQLNTQTSGADPGFQVRGRAYLKKLRRAEGGAIIFGVFHVKNHDFTPKKEKIFPIAEGGAKIFGVFRVKNHDFTPKNLFFSNLRWGARRVRPRPWTCINLHTYFQLNTQTCLAFTHISS